jgi:hypothetical protein
MLTVIFLLESVRLMLQVLIVKRLGRKKSVLSWFMRDRGSISWAHVKNTGTKDEKFLSTESEKNYATNYLLCNY